MAIFDPPWAVNGDTRAPTVGEQDQGFPCGPADRPLFNYLFQDIHQAINALSTRLGDADIPVLGWQSSPPGAPAESSRYVVKSPGSGAWASQSNKIAIYIDGQWVYVDPVTGLQANFIDTGAYVLIFYNGTTWVDWTARNIPKNQTAVFATPGTTNWTVPANVYRVRRIRVVGGGGGGGAGNGTQGQGGGGAGGYAEDAVDVNPGDVIAVTVGAAGTGGTAGGAGGTGGTSSFGAVVSATGGEGGQSTAGAPRGGVPGVGSNGYLNLSGGHGADGTPNANTRGGHGGASAFGGGGRAAHNQVGVAGSAPGAGGGGSYGNVAANGGAGAPGLIIIEW